MWVNLQGENEDYLAVLCSGAVLNILRRLVQSYYISKCELPKISAETIFRDNSVKYEANFVIFYSIHHKLFLHKTVEIFLPC